MRGERGERGEGQRGEEGEDGFGEDALYICHLSPCFNKVLPGTLELPYYE